MKFGVTQFGLVGGKLHCGAAHGVIADFVGRVNAALVLLDPLLVVVEADHAHMLCKFDRQGHADIAEPNDGKTSFS